jgi:cell division protease FtsH
LEKYKKLVWLVVAGLVLAGAAILLLDPTPLHKRNEVATQMETQSWKWFAKERNLSEFSTDLRAGKVSAIGIGVEYALINIDKDTRYYVRIDTQRPLFLDLLKEIQAPPAKGGSVQPPTLVSLGGIAPPQNLFVKMMNFVSPVYLVPIAMLVLMGFLVVQMGVFDQSGRLFKRVQRPTTRFTDIIGVEEAKEAVQDLVAYLKNPQQFSALGATAPHGVILAGPPGTGKTRLAQAMAGEAGCGFISITGSDFSDKFLGVGVGRVKKLMETARKQAPTVIFIDEIDAIGSRSSGGDAASTENNRIINAILVALDGFSANDGVIVVGATNNLSSIDPALVREGRFDRTCHTTLPTIAEREKLFGMYAAKLKQGTDLDTRQLARLSAGLSPAAIATVVNAAALLAGKEKAMAVTHSYFMRSLEKHSMGSPTFSGKEAMSLKERERVAVHEAGHALVTRALGMGVLEKVSILPRGAAGGVTWVTEDSDITLYTEQHLRKRLAVLLGGRAAELLALGDMSTGASDDLKRVTSLAHQMVTRFGFSKTLGALSYDGLPEEAQRSSVVAADVLAETRAIIAEAEATASVVLSTHRAALNAVTTALLEEETISGSAVGEYLVSSASATEALAA